MDAVSRAKLHDEFVATFAHPDHPSVPATDEELKQLAAYLTTVLPASYVQFMKHHGSVYFPSILRLAMDYGLERPDFREMLPPKEIPNKCRELWCQWLPTGLFVFAFDCLGNPFCFRQTMEPQDDAPVIFLSLQREQILTLEPFDDLLIAYLQERKRHSTCRTHLVIP